MPTRSRLAGLLSRRARPIDSRDATTFSAAALRTRILRFGLAAVALALLTAAVAFARDDERHGQGLLPAGTTGVVVIDLSVSIGDAHYRTVRRVLRRLIAEDASIGLVLFSDVPYELFPPGTPASELRPVLRLLTSPTARPPVNPWIQAFRAGTRVSTALELAEHMLERDAVRSKSILLISDLETAPDDVPALTRTVGRLQRSSIALRVVGLGPSSDARRIFAGMLQEGAFDDLSPARREVESAAETSASLPVTLLFLGAVLFVVLATNEHFTGRLTVTGGPQERG